MPVKFNSEDHSYTTAAGEKYISVTQLIGLYTPPFEGDYWSTYKAAKDVLIEHNMWVEFKKKAGGWDYVVDLCAALGEQLPHRSQIMAAKAAYLVKWEKEKNEASDKGRRFHEKAEGQTHQARLITGDLQEIPSYTGKDLLAAQDFTSNGVYTELLLYSDKYKIAGQADWVLKSGRWISIKDYKTCKKIPTEGFMEQTLMSPLHKLPNAKFSIYTVQLILYAYLLELAGYQCKKLVLEHVKIDDKDVVLERIPHTVEYDRKIAEALIKHYVERQKQTHHKERSSSGPKPAFVITPGGYRA